MTVANQERPVLRPGLRSPRAAAVAGIVFSVLFTISIVLVRIALPDELDTPSSGTWVEANARAVSLALTLVPFAGIAFLWFMGVVRDRLGRREDQFVSTVFMGSGLLFLAMVFVAAAIAGGILLSLDLDSVQLIDSGGYGFGRAVIYVVMNVYAVRMAGVFMFSLGTLWMRTRAMPRPAVFITYGLALIVLVSVSFSWWLILVFPAWVLGISLYILIETSRGKAVEADEALGGMPG
jgi:MFS family permease